VTLRIVQPFCNSRRQNSFSLIEVVLALAVTVVAIFSIISLFSVGLTTAGDSRIETRAAYLADEITSDLRSGPFTNAAILVPAGNGLSTNVSLNLAVPSTIFLDCDTNSDILGVVSGNTFTNGSTAAQDRYLVQLQVTPSFNTNLAMVSVNVSAPAAANLAARSQFGFQTMIANKQ
jgi:Tfp pilus assembly protein PilW